MLTTTDEEVTEPTKDDDGSADKDSIDGIESDWEDDGNKEAFQAPTAGESPLPQLKGRGATLVVDQSGLHNI